MTNPQVILIIDNDEDLVRALALRLDHHGYRCITAFSGAQGISAFDAGPVDLVITDLNMPCGDGVSLAESIRDRSGVPIIVVTGFEEDFRRRLRSIRNASLIQKPFESEELVALVELELAQVAA